MIDGLKEYEINLFSMENEIQMPDQNALKENPLEGDEKLSPNDKAESENEVVYIDDHALAQEKTNLEMDLPDGDQEDSFKHGHSQAKLNVHSQDPGEASHILDHSKINFNLEDNDNEATDQRKSLIDKEITVERTVDKEQGRGSELTNGKDSLEYINGGEIMDDEKDDPRRQNESGKSPSFKRKLVCISAISVILLIAIAAVAFFFIMGKEDGVSSIKNAQQGDASTSQL